MDAIEPTPIEDAMKQVTTAWGEEPGIMFATEPAGTGRIRFKILEVGGSHLGGEKILASVTLTRHRWDRVANVLGVTKTEREQFRDETARLRSEGDAAVRERDAALALVLKLQSHMNEGCKP